MTIQPETGIHGYLATEPVLTGAGNQVRLYARLGTRPREQSAGSDRPTPGYVDLVQFGPAAQQSHAMYRRGDDILALGRFIPARVGPDRRVRDAQFIAERMAPDTNHHDVIIRRPETEQTA